MNAIILSAGRGERLRPLTDTTPKPLLNVGGQRLIEYLIRSLVSAGIDNIIINTAHLADKFPVVLGNGEQYGATISYSIEPHGALETGGGIINALPHLGSKPFLVVNGDIWTDYPFTSLINKLTTNILCHIVLVNNPSHHLQGDFALTVSGMVLQKGAKRYTYSGIGVYDPQLFAGLASGRRPLRPILLQAITTGQISGELYHGKWSDIGTPSRLFKLNNQLADT